MRAAVVDSSGVVTNVVKVTEDTNFNPGPNSSLIILDDKDYIDIGHIWHDGVWTVPEPPEPEEVPVPLEDQLAELRATVDMLLLNALEG